MGQKTTGPRGSLTSGTLLVLAILLVFLAALAVVFFGLPGSSPARGAAALSETAGEIERDGSLTASVRAEPRTFNRLVGRDFSTEVFTYLTQAKLARVNRVTGELEPELAESWSAQDEVRLKPDSTTEARLKPSATTGQTYTIRLRRGVQFSDGAPFTSADVLFSFDAAYDQRMGSPLAELLLVDGKPLRVAAADPSTVTITFPSPFGPGLRLLDNLPILPKHRLDAALGDGTLRQTWTTATPPSELTGLGPFMLDRYEPGQRLTFVRNPHYWRRRPDGATLPALARLTLEIVPDQNAEVIRLESGQIDFTQAEVRAEDYVVLKRAADAGRLRLTDLGVGLDADVLWFNLAKPTGVWLQTDFRRAVSHAIDRRAFADTVFLGAATPIWGPITPANKDWYVDGLPRFDFDPARARSLFKQLGLSDHGGARFTLLTQKGNTALERGATVIRDDLAKFGITVDVVALEVGSLVERLTKGDYDAIYFRMLTSDTDPAMNLDFWLSAGGTHVWNPEQKKPATDWEARVDDLMTRQARALDAAERKRLFAEAQRILAEQQPVIYFAAPRVIVATSRRVANAEPSVMRPNLLWKPEALGSARLRPSTTNEAKASSHQTP